MTNYVDFKNLESIDPEKFRGTNPYPWINPAGLLTDEGYGLLLDNMPELRGQFHIGQFRPSRGISLPDWIRKYEGRVCALHLNDATEEDNAPLGQGACRAEQSIRTALDTGVDTYIVEVPLVRDTLDDVKRDVEYAQRLVT